MTNKLPDRYDAKTREKFWQNHWKEQGIFAFKNDKAKSETFVIDTPPPTVSGLLHMGHVFSYTQADFVARFQRMIGKDVFYPMGFDDNGLPTERLVEKIIGKKAGIYEAENGHGSFVKKCREEVEAAELEFEALFNSIALSVDWNEKYQTISPESQKISQASFVDLYRKGLVEKKFEPVFWDISDRTALAQADLIDKEVEGQMNYIEFEVDCHPELSHCHPEQSEGSQHVSRDSSPSAQNDKEEVQNDKIVIMTTRPELLPACVAVMVHPDDERYKKFHGKNAITPLFGVKVKIIADDLVQLDKGTGAVMCCTFGDETDIRWWKKHNLELKVIVGKDGKINFDHELVAGKTIKQAKDAIIEALKNTASCHPERSEGSQQVGRDSSASPQNDNGESQNDKNSVLQKQETITRAVKCAERSGVPIEILVVPQWFIKILDKKELLKEKAAECNWYPDYMKVRIDQWIDGLQWDWCISRQRFFGVKFPVWYSKRAGEEGKILVAEVNQLPCDPEVDLPQGYSRDEVQAETDIMDTWATSSISPQLSSKGISSEISFDKARHEKLFPADLRPQAHEIIRTWAFYTIAKAALHQNSIPWKNLMISGWCLAADKTKMSKSKGNVVTPTALIEEKGSDIVRYWASTSHLGADTAYSEDVFKIGQKLITKLFNAAKFASMNFDKLGHPEQSEGSQNASQNSSPLAQNDNKIEQNDKITESSDLWILARLHQTVAKATVEFEQFEYARAREAIEQFFWHDFCDNYLEICKVRSYGTKAEKLAAVELSEAQKLEIEAQQQSAILTLRICLNTLLKLFSPFIPHICDEIYAVLFAEEFAENKSINARGNWPKLSEKFFNEKYLEIGEAALEVIFEVRKFKSERNISMKTTVKKLVVNCEKDLSEIAQDLKNVCNAEELEFVKSGQLVEVISE
jgi:valyl-tRNA synthetase